MKKGKRLKHKSKIELVSLPTIHSPVIRNSPTNTVLNHPLPNNNEIQVSAESDSISKNLATSLHSQLIQQRINLSNHFDNADLIKDLREKTGGSTGMLKGTSVVGINPS